MKLIESTKRLLWNHGLITMLLFFNVLPLITVYTTSPIILDYHGDVTKAVIYQSLALIAIYIGYRYNNVKKRNTCRLFVNVNWSYFIFYSSVSLFGVYIAYLNISMFTSISELQGMVMGGEDISQIRSEAGSGGLSGIFKMFGTAPLFSFLCTSSLLMFYDCNKKSKQILVYTLMLSLVCTLAKVMLVFDRLSILAIIVVFVYNFFYNKSFPTVFKVAFIALLLLLVSFLTLLRMSDVSMGEFLGTYFNLGVYNLEISIEKQQHFNYFFTETFLQPLSFVFKYFNIPFHSYTAEDWVWNPAQSFWGFYFVDTNWIGLILLPLLGVAIRKFEIGKFNKKFWALMYFVFAYTTFSMTTIPVFRAPEFLLMLVLAYIGAKCLVRCYKVVN